MKVRCVWFWEVSCEVLELLGGEVVSSGKVR